MQPTHNNHNTHNTHNNHNLLQIFPYTFIISFKHDSYFFVYLS